MPTTPNYILKAGAVIHEFGSSDFYTLANIPDDFAEKWLATHPDDKILFERMPSDWEERVEKRKAADSKESNGTTVKASADEDGQAPLDFQDEVTADKLQPAEKPASRRGRSASK